MYDLERITKIISEIEKYFKDLDEISIKGEDDLEDKRNFYACSMLIFSILNRVIDLGSEMVTANNFGIPVTYKDIFRLLAKNSNQ